MDIRIGYDLAMEVPLATAMVLMLNVHPERAHDLATPDIIRTDPVVSVSLYRDSFGNICARLVAPRGRLRIWNDAVVRDSGMPDPVARDAEQHCISDLPYECMTFLLGSRYCETDELSAFAWSTFGDTKPGWDRVQAIVDFVHNHIAFGYAHARPTRTALQAYREGRGVCRDFAHLAITLCRSMSIPARYCTGYMGDIGVPRDPEPMDFNAWFEVYLGGRWYTFDARHNRPRIGRVVIGRGRDASDVAITTSFGPTELVAFKVFTNEIVQ
jgi:transglutaminase-like putative cysteine protease